MLFGAHFRTLPFEPGFGVQELHFSTLSMLAFWALPTPPLETLEIMEMVEATCPAYRRMPNISENGVSSSNEKIVGASSRQRKARFSQRLPVLFGCPSIGLRNICSEGPHAALVWLYHVIAAGIEADGLYRACPATCPAALALSSCRPAKPWSPPRDLRSTPVLLCSLPKQAHDSSARACSECRGAGPCEG